MSIYYMVFGADNNEEHIIFASAFWPKWLLWTLFYVRYFYVSCMELNKWTAYNAYLTIGICVLSVAFAQHTL